MPSSKETVSIFGYADAIIEQDGECVSLTISDALSYLSASGRSMTVELAPEEVDRMVEALESVKASAMTWVGNNEASVFPVEPRPVRYGDNVEAMVQGYIDAQVPMALDYTDFAGTRTTRVVSPFEVETVSEVGGFAPPKYVRTWDHDAEDYRSFRIARINGLAPSAEEYVGSASNPV